MRKNDRIEIVISIPRRHELRKRATGRRQIGIGRKGKQEGDK